jgi:gluconate 2-dehydrogenase gamma chain
MLALRPDRPGKHNGGEDTSMSTHNEARRAFLKGAAIGAGAVAGAGFVPDALAQRQDHDQLAATAAASTPHAHGPHQGAFFNEDDAATVAAFVERLMPGVPGKPGATEAGVLNYIDLALAGAYADLQDFYRRGLASLDAFCREMYKERFSQLDAARQDAVIASLEEGKGPGFTWPSAQAFFNTVRMHAMEGMFADPVYGGNKDFAGWLLVSFPGAQPVFSPDDLKSRDAFTRTPIIGLQAQGKEPVRRI